MINKKVFVSFILSFCLFSTLSQAGNFERKLLQQHDRHTIKWNSRSHEPRARGRGRVPDPRLIQAFFLGLVVSNLLIEGADALHHSTSVKQPSAKDCDRVINGLCTTVKGGAHALGNSAANITQVMQKATLSGLSEFMCSDRNPDCLSSDGVNVTCSGDFQDVEHCIEKLNNFDEIRQAVTPVSPAHARTQSSQNKLPNFSQVLACLAIDEETVENAHVTECHVGQLCDMALADVPPPYVALRYDSKFNQRMAQSYIQTLAEESEFFSYIQKLYPQAIAIHGEHLVVHYEVFNDFLGRLNGEISRDTRGLYSVSFAFDSVIRRVIAAVSGHVTLEYSSEEGKYFVNTASLGETRSREERDLHPPSLHLIIDKSGSMANEPIAAVNQAVPRLLTQIHKTLPPGKKIKIVLYELNHDFRATHDFTLTDNSVLPPWKTIQAGGGTNLIPVGIQLATTDAHNIVVAITDGLHEGPRLDSHYEYLEKVRASGKFAQPFLCKVGSQESPYFVDIARIFSGSYTHEDTVDECIQHISSKVEELHAPKSPIVLTIDGENRVVWQSDELGLHSTGQSVKDGDTIVFGSFKAEVETPDREAQRLRNEKKAIEKRLRLLDGTN